MGGIGPAAPLSEVGDLDVHVGGRHHVLRLQVCGGGGEGRGGGPADGPKGRAGGGTTHTQVGDQASLF